MAVLPRLWRFLPMVIGSHDCATIVQVEDEGAHETARRAQLDCFSVLPAAALAGSRPPVSLACARRLRRRHAPHKAATVAPRTWHHWLHAPTIPSAGTYRPVAVVAGAQTSSV